MTFKEKTLSVLIAATFAAGMYYHARLLAEQQRAELAEQQLKSTAASLQKIQHSQRDVAKLDDAYTKELIHAQNTIDALRRDVAIGVKRLRLTATCKGQLPRTDAAPGVDDATAPELTADARQAYFRLREELALTRSALTGLQEYVQQQCLK
ncbi:lysis protein [Franconibacter sp. IITDAS19]|uniref:lysis protein n=1 Tax=Franconibacter sp. IITDAS19 TaxID=2930569 RepID=UPI001FF7CD9D|nr:lysis protein [Franconibacter sp. IITDAS19]MCK1967154.1 lysis protein [Franconibacter sp. IITDAS19]